MVFVKRAGNRLPGLRSYNYVIVPFCILIVLEHAVFDFHCSHYIFSDHRKEQDILQPALDT